MQKPQLLSWRVCILLNSFTRLNSQTLTLHTAETREEIVGEKNIISVVLFCDLEWVNCLAFFLSLIHYRKRISHGNHLPMAALTLQQASRMTEQAILFSTAWVKISTALQSNIVFLVTEKW